MTEKRDLVSFLRKPSKDEVASKAFRVILENVTTGRKINSEKLRLFREEVNTETGLKNSVLMARAMTDLNDPEGKFVVSFIKRSKQDPFAVAGKALLTTEGVDGASVKHEKTIVTVLLNTDSPVCKSRLDNINLNDVDFFSVLSAIIQAEVYLETMTKNGTIGGAMTRSEYYQALEPVKNGS